MGPPEDAAAQWMAMKSTTSRFPAGMARATCCPASQFSDTSAWNAPWASRSTLRTGTGAPAALPITTVEPCASWTVGELVTVTPGTFVTVTDGVLATVTDGVFSTVTGCGPLGGGAARAARETAARADSTV